MTIKRVYFRDDNFVLTQIYGKLTNPEIGDHVIEMNRECSADHALIELADCRFLTDVSELNANQLLIAATLEKGHNRAIGGKGAIVVASDQIYGLARVYASVAANIRSGSQVFRDMDAAITWLGVEHLKADISRHAEEISQAT